MKPLPFRAISHSSMTISSMPTTPYQRSLLWFRRDLRIFDHAALHHALRNSDAVYCIFVFDQAILEALPRQDRRIEFLHASLCELQRELAAAGGALIVRHARADDEIPRIAKELAVDAVFANHDYEPQALARDATVAAALQQNGIAWQSFKDQVIFEKDEVLSQAGQPFSVFTPYKNAWLKRLQFESSDYFLKPYPVACRSSPKRARAPNSPFIFH